MTGIQLNREQEAAVKSRKNTVVTAGAGSGKTSVLASRYAHLVTEEGITVDRILTLTFTRKAAAEMYRRIHAVLSRIAAEAAGTRQERARNAVRDFFRARIQTLDSYGSSIARQAAVRYGIAPDFLIDDEKCRSLAVRTALPFLVARENHPAIQRLYGQKRPEEIASGLFAETVWKYGAIDAPPGFAEEMKKQCRIILPEWGKSSDYVGNILDELARALADAPGDAFTGIVSPAMKPFLDGEIVIPSQSGLENYFACILSAPGAEEVRIAEAHPLRQELLACLNFVDSLAWIGIQKGKKDSPAKLAIRKLREETNNFSSIAVFSAQAGTIFSLMRLLGEFQENWLAEKRREKILGFSDTARLARAILRDHPDVRSAEKAAFDAIMIDEFQDNNELQKELLFLLAEKQDRNTTGIPGTSAIEAEKLFFVGDEKQSIYRFRGADVSVFRKLSGELAGESLSLRTNYRSAPALIGVFNALFGGNSAETDGAPDRGAFPGVFVSPRADNPLPPFEAAYTPLRAPPAEEYAKKTDGVPGRFAVYVLDAARPAGTDGDGEAPDDAGEELNGAENEAVFVAGKIEELLNQKNEAGAARYAPGDIAVLFRSHSPQRFFEKHLNLRGIPYAAEGLTGVFADAPVNDLLAPLRLAAWPLDTEAYAVMLRSPFASLSPGGMAEAVAEFNREREQAGTSAETLLPFSDATLPLLNGTDRERFINARNLYRELRKKAETETIAALLSWLWYDSGYRYETEWHPETESYRELYDYLFSMAVQADSSGMSLAGFTGSLLGLRDGGGTLEFENIPLERSGAVHLMTIHKSKGLEFPVVFLVCCGNRSRTGGIEGDVYETAEGGLALSPPLPPECAGRVKIKRNYFYEKSLAEERKKETAELRRLLYVAMTRAERELYLSGSFPLGRNETITTTENLPERLCAAVQEKCEKQEKEAETNNLPGDSIINNGTLFGLILPALAARLPEKNDPPGEQIFAVESIPVLTDRDIRTAGSGPGLFHNSAEGMSRFIRRAAPFYEQAAILDTPRPENPRRTPVSFRDEAAGASIKAVFRHDSENSGEGADDIFEKIDAILARHKKKDGGEIFTAARFGVIAHACAKDLLDGAEPAIPPGEGGALTPGESETVLRAGVELAKRFLRSPLGHKAASAVLRKTEYPFKMLEKTRDGGSLFIDGVIDLLFEDESTVYVADFKTDSRENPAEHVFQMAFYYRAARELRQKDCRVWLYYLRTGRAVEMTGAAAEISENAG
ncbi:MAG: UvrD-helicase domain-containing protein [Spirochaetaceae bacterium]|jgi:ATP-dependent helicase/nuclease subunit A|nr:UvrD-helicase domain-containing protein [Spirochaetaceae bacterium]